MKIKHVNGTYWNEDQNCFTHAECAATEYEAVADLPYLIETNNGSELKLDDGYYWYSDDPHNTDAIAWVVS